MISNGVKLAFPHSRHATQANGNWRDDQPRPFVQEDTLERAELQIERKSFVLVLKSNPRGQFIRITEDVGGRRNSIIIPSTGFDDFIAALKKVAPKDLPSSASQGET